MSTDLEAEILDRIRALDDSDRRRVLNFLSGCVPEAVAAALEWIDRPAAAQATEDNHG